MGATGAALIGQEAAGEGGDDLPVGASLAEGLDGLVDELDAPLGAGEGAGLFGKADAGEEHIGIAGGLGGEDLLEDDEIAGLQALAHLGSFGRGVEDVFAEDIEGFHLALAAAARIWGAERPGLAGTAAPQACSKC